MGSGTHGCKPPRAAQVRIPVRFTANIHRNNSIPTRSYVRRHRCKRAFTGARQRGLRRASGVVAGRPLLIALPPSRSTRTLSVRLDLLGSRREGQNVRQEYHEDGEGAAARPSPHPSSPFLPAPPLKCPLLASKPLQTRCVNNGGCRWLVSKQDFGTGFLLPPPWQRIGHACLHQFLTASSFRRLIRPRARQTHVPRPTHPTRLA